ncbi:12218_t:CDS:2 [Entrophospora sp. SA101]|nr:7658_t:CDS:2 [Entrophospora sp. SA101]CAJ0883598.1 12218_t:CDS:2 [Entrophospora sp. SA101]
MAIIDHFSFYVIFIFSILDDFGFRHLLWGGAQAQKRVDLGGHLHPFMSQSLSIINQYFDDLILKDQDVLKDENCWNKVLGCIPNENKKNTLKKHWLENLSQTSSDRWKDITDELNLTINKGNLPMCENEIILQYAYPRLDKAVSININHLLKSPFCVHPKTGKIIYHYHHSDTVEEISLFDMSRIKNNIKKINHKHSIF